MRSAILAGGVMPTLDEAKPLHESGNAKPGALGDYGHRGHDEGDHIVMHNTHPHIEHSVGYDGDSPDGPQDNHQRAVGEIHGHASVHIVHDPRGKGPEHHPPMGLEDRPRSQSHADAGVFGEEKEDSVE